jgi:hypothetical protein
MRTFRDGLLVKSNAAPIRTAEISCSSEEPSAPQTDSEPPIALDKFIEESGISAVTVWRYRRAGLLRTLNIYGRHYLTRSEIRRFNERAAAGEFARAPSRPRRAKNQK